MFLFVDPLAPSYTFFVASAGKILHESSHAIHGKEFESFPEITHELLERFPVTKIAVVNGPGPFTALRIVTLTLNTIALVKGISLVPIHFFELGTLQGKPLPYCLKANRGEYLIRDREGHDALESIERITGSYWGLGDMHDFPDGGVILDDAIDPKQFLSALEEREGISIVTPLYIKDPKITPSAPK